MKGWRIFRLVLRNDALRHSLKARRRSRSQDTCIYVLVPMIQGQSCFYRVGKKSWFPHGVSSTSEDLRDCWEVNNHLIFPFSKPVWLVLIYLLGISLQSEISTVGRSYLDLKIYRYVNVHVCCPVLKSSIPEKSLLKETIPCCSMKHILTFSQNQL